jgi:hypothetical protein
VFLAFRILVVWVLLATSALAWASFAIPNQREGWSLWWKHMIAWNVFGPLYMLTLIPGLVMIGGSSEMMLRLQSAGANIGGANAIFQQLLFYAFSALIFVGGLSLSLKSSYAVTAKGAPIIGGWASKFGAFQTGTDKLGAVGQYTGITPNVQALGERAQQFGGDITAGLRGRAPALFGTKEEAAAAARSRFGVRGGEAEVAKLQADRVKREQEILKGQDEASLRRALSSGNRDVAIAAGELLLAKGALSPQGFKDMQQKYSRISPVAAQQFRERADAELIKIASNKKFTSASEMESYLELIKDPKKAKEFSDAAQKGKSKAIAIEAAVNKGLITDRNGKRLTLDDALAERADTFTDDDLLGADDYFAAGSRPMPKVLQDKLQDSMRQTKKFGKILTSSSSPAQQMRILEQYADLKKSSQQARRDVAALRKTDRQYSSNIEKLRRDLRRTTDPALRTNIENAIDDLSEKQVDLKEQMTDLQKNITTK